jgi:Mrp family chromosome partitioning ATPase
MSKNFELLQRLEREAKALDVGPARTNGHAAASQPVIPYDLKDARDEEILKLVHRLFVNSDQVAHVVVFADLEQQHGSSFICARAAELLSCSARVCLIDANLRSPSLHEYFEVPNHSGLSDALLCNQSFHDFLQPVVGRRLSLLTAGTRGISESLVLPPEMVRPRLLGLRDEFEFVLIDAAPVLCFRDASLLGASAHGLVMVVQAGSARLESARKAKTELESVNVRLLGTVLNNQEFPVPESIYRKLA